MVLIFKDRPDAVSFFSQILRNIEIENDGVILTSRYAIVYDSDTDSGGLVQIKDHLTLEYPVFYNRKLDFVEELPENINYKRCSYLLLKSKIYNFLINKNEILFKIGSIYNSEAKRKKTKTTITYDNDSLFFEIIPSKKRSQLESLSFSVPVTSTTKEYKNIQINLNIFYWMLTWFFEEEENVLASFEEKFIYFTGTRNSNKFFLKNLFEPDIV